MTQAREKVIQAYAQRQLAEAGEDIQRLVNLANQDLYSGPLYIDTEGDIVGPFDEHIGQFDFVGAVERIGDAFDEVDTIYVDDDGMIYESDPYEMAMYWEYYDPETDDFISAQLPSPAEQEESFEAQIQAEKAQEAIDRLQAQGIEAQYTGPRPYYIVERRELLNYILGSELASHVA